MDPKQLAVLQALAGALGAAGINGAGGPQFRATPSTPSTPYYTGPYGLFGVAGLERDVISTRIQPLGLADRLPVVGTNVMNPLFPYLTGFQAGTGSEPTAPCDDPPVAGAGKSCLQTAQFGRVSRLSRTVDITRLGEQMNRGEFLDLRFVNDPLLGGMGGITKPSSIPGSAALRQETLMRFIEMGIEFQNWVTRKTFDGNPANNTGGDGYMEFPGLDILIGTGKVDALTNVACPALDSDIKNAAYKRVDSNGSWYVETLAYLMRYVRWNAQQTNMGEVTWAFVMTPSAFYELTSVWPCAYMTYRCNLSGNNTQFVSANDQIAMRDDMRNGNYLLIDGIRYNVIIDNNIPEDTNTNNSSVASGCFSSDIYIVPLTVRGGMPVTYWEYFDFRTSLDIAAQGAGGLARNYYWTDDGRYLWHLRPPTNTCIQWFATMRPRLVMRTPHLAGRLTNVLYCPIQHERQVRNSDPYFVNGGNTSGRTPATEYAEWGTVDQH